MQKTAKRFKKGDSVEVSLSTALNRWTAAEYLGTTTSAGNRRHAAQLPNGQRVIVPSRRIRARTNQ